MFLCPPVQQYLKHASDFSKTLDNHTVCCLLQARGFVNYYGPQRFGSGQSVQSDRVGLALLKEDLVSAADDYYEHEPDVTTLHMVM